MPTPPRFPGRLPRWGDLCTTDFAGLDPARTVAVLPLAATEQHGPHLPLSVDADLLDGVLDAAAPHLPDDCPVWVLPPQVVGLSPEHQRFPGTLTLGLDTLVHLWCDLGASVARAGVRKLLLFNSHGGHTGAMDVVGRELRSRHDLLVYSSSWFNLPLLDEHGQDLNARISADEHRFGIHGGQVETAMMLALHPERVRMDRARDFASTSRDRSRRYPVLGNGRSAKLAWQTQDYNAQGAVGNAAAADATLGRALVDAAGRSLAQLLQEFSQLPLSTLVDGPDLAG
ncbi:creatininase family protein [Aquabacterium sp. A08]|uniref:creatininase family protein n=1 Tax=Aquabacterium sp. A08 TaxID=2718532 RepID=UPI001423407C|nr:creatininase family protein [Aquabacterium sp. A08]NIC43018.1 creatininase family protein [Aquabacterium sp. A08]